MKIVVHLNFGHPMIGFENEVQGCHRRVLSVPERSPVLHVADLLKLQADGLVFAVNGNVVAPDFVLSDGDRLSILRPMSGG